MQSRLYPNSQKVRLVDSVRMLCERWNRPICSKDAITFWNDSPQFRPILTQAVGQLLIKAARESPDGTPRIYRIGVIGNLAYYAPDYSPHWQERLKVHRSILRVLWHNKVQIPWHAQTLLGGPHHALAISALSGFLEEWKRFTKNKESDVTALESRFHRMLTFAERKAGNVLWQNFSPDLITRAEAEEILRSDHKARLPYLNTDTLSVNKHLARLAWPLTPLFETKGYFESQLRLYCAGRWPLPEDDSITCRARWLCLIYGGE